MPEPGAVVLKRSRFGIWGIIDFAQSPDAVRISQFHSRFSPNSISHSINRIAFGPSPVHRSHLIVAADVRLHNRLELINRLGLDEAPGLSDAQLLLRAYEKWGEELPTFLLGEFAFAIWDDRRKRLFCCRDQIGFRPFLYWRDGSILVFASSRHTILSVPGVPRRPNRRKLAAAIVFGGDQYYHDETFHAGIMSLPAGCLLTVDQLGAGQRTYWTPELRPELVPKRPQEVLEALRELLFESVRCRLGDDEYIAAELSGGLDSSAVTGIAAKVLGDRGQHLLALSAVLPENRPEGPADERNFIDEFREWSNVRIEYITAPGRGPFDGIEDPAQFEETPLRTSRFYLYEEFERAAVDAGAQVILQGGLGELGPSCRAERYFVELALKLRWLRLFSELDLLRKTHGNSPLRRIARQVAVILRRTPRRPPYILLQPEFGRLSDVPQMPVCSSPWQRDHQRALIQRFLRGTGHETGQTPRGYIRRSNPLLDKRVLEFCLAAPPETKVRNGYWRYLIRGCLEGILPAKIQWRTDKIPFSPDYFTRYNAQLRKAQDFVAAIRPNDPIRSVIDVPRLTQSMQPVGAGIRSETARDIVPATIYAICFLRQFPEFCL